MISSLDLILGESASILKLKSKISKIAPTDCRVLILGQNGTGKELVASAIHELSKRASHPLVAINCSAISPSLVESELFGHEKGAFSGAVARRVGLFERANGGTLFLDERGDMPRDMQVKLLRVLQTGEFNRVGGNETLKVHVRVISATNVDLDRAVAQGRFREDLLHRLSVFPLLVPALRDRGDDIILLAEHFLQGRLKLDIGAQKVLGAYTYPGNVRELQNIVERLALSVEGEVVVASDAKDAIGSIAPTRPLHRGQKGHKYTDADRKKMSEAQRRAAAKRAAAKNEASKSSEV